MRGRSVCVSYVVKFGWDSMNGVGVLDPPLSESIRQALHSARNITELYTHQVAAIGALSQGKDVIVSTSTASGKSVIYQVNPHILGGIQ